LQVALRDETFYAEHMSEDS